MSTTVDSRTRATGTGKPRQKAQLSDRARSERKLGWLLAGPAFVIMLLVTLYPIVQALWDSLFSFRLTAPGDKEFVGLSNYATVFSDIVFWRDLGVTVLITVVTVAIEQATRAFGTSDVALAEEVIEADHVIDDKAIALDELAIQILARQQPVARDLRIVVAALRVSASLERMGDIAEHIAQLTRMRFPERAVPKGLKNTFTKMGELDVEVARTLTELLRTEDLSLVENLRSLDDQLDDGHLSVFEKVLSEAWKGEAAATVDATLASRYLERFADHAVSVAKKVAYLATGDWRHDTETIWIFGLSLDQISVTKRRDCIVTGRNDSRTARIRS